MGAVFLGTPAAAVPSLCALAQVASVDLVITQPDRSAGRGGAVRPSPVKVAARQFGFDVSQPASDADLRSVLATAAPDVGLVVAYGRILRPDVLDIPAHGFLNVHFSLLPRWRGAAPVERAIAAGDTRTGVTLMRIDEGLDTGPVIAERATDIADDDTGGTLTARLAYLGARVVDDTMPGYLLGRRLPVPQIAAGSTQARSLSRDEARIASTLSAIVAERRIRAFTPRPGAWCGTVDGALKLRGVGSIVERAPAGVISLVDGAVVFGFSDGGIELTTVQPAGKPAMDAQAWMHGRRGEPAAVVD